MRRSRPPEVRTGLEEGLGDVDDAMELVEWGKITVGHGSDRVIQFYAAEECLIEQVLFVLEEQVDGGGRKPREVCDLSERSIVDSEFTEHLFSCVQDLLAVPGPSSSTPSGAGVGLRGRGSSMLD